MTPRTRWPRLRALCAIASICAAGVALTAHFLTAQTTHSDNKAVEAGFEEVVKPFFAQHCVSCHNSELSTAGLRVDQLNAALEDRQLPAWEAIRNRLQAGTMPPKGLPQPAAAAREQMVAWITHA